MPENDYFSLLRFCTLNLSTCRDCKKIRPHFPATNRFYLQKKKCITLLKVYLKEICGKSFMVFETGTTQPLNTDDPLGDPEFSTLDPILNYEGGIEGSILVSPCPSVRLSVCRQNRARCVSSTVIAALISYLHSDILSTNFRRCVELNFVMNPKI